MLREANNAEALSNHPKRPEPTPHPDFQGQEANHHIEIGIATLPARFLPQVRLLEVLQELGRRLAVLQLLQNYLH